LLALCETTKCLVLSFVVSHKFIVRIGNINFELNYIKLSRTGKGKVHPRKVHEDSEGE